MDPMDSYQWKNRVLLMFASPDDPELTNQRDTLSRHEAELADRDMVVFAVVGDDQIVPLYGDAPPAAQAARLREQFEVSSGDGFTALLVGKDGGVKWRKNRPAIPQELFGLIDAMPMRRNER